MKEETKTIRLAADVYETIDGLTEESLIKLKRLDKELYDSLMKLYKHVGKMVDK